MVGMYLSGVKVCLHYILECLILQSNFKNHRYTHMTEKPHKCQFCGKGFIRRSLMISHQDRCSSAATNGSTSAVSGNIHNNLSATVPMIAAGTSRAFLSSPTAHPDD